MTYELETPICMQKKCQITNFGIFLQKKFHIFFSNIYFHFLIYDAPSPVNQQFTNEDNK